MKWFKHLANSTSDGDLVTAIMEFGPAGYYVFFNTLETLSREDAIEEPLDMNFKAFKMWFPGISGPKLKLILNYFSSRDRFQLSYTSNRISISCQKLTAISDTYTKNVRSNLKKSGSQKLEVRSKNKKEIKSPPQNFNIDGVYSYWQSLKGITTHKGITKRMKDVIRRVLGEHSFEDIAGSIKNYNALMVDGRDFYGKYKYTLENFFRPDSQKSSPFKQYLPECDPLNSVTWKVDKPINGQAQHNLNYHSVAELENLEGDEYVLPPKQDDATIYLY